MINKLKDLFFQDNVSRNRKIIQLLILAIATTIVYVNIFQNSFLGDDKETFFNWPQMQQANFPALLQGAYPPNFESAPQYRPIKGVVHAISYKISNNNLHFYHLQAILVQIAIVFLIYLITQTITKKPSLAFITALLFSIHPIHTEAVTFLTASFDTNGILFFFLALYLYIKSKTTPKYPVRYYGLSVFFAFLAFFSYELTLSLPLILIFYDLCFNKLKLKNILYYLPYFLLITIFFILRATFLPETNQLIYLLGSKYLTLVTTLKAFLVYIFTLIVPINLSVIQVLPGDIVPFSKSGIYLNFENISKQTVFEPAVILAITLILSLISLAIYFKNKKPIITFSIGLFFISLLPVSNIIPLIEIMTIRFAYIASYGFILLFAFLFLYIYQSEKVDKLIKNSLVIALIFIISTFSLITFTRNLDWQSEFTMFKSISKQDVGGYYAKYYLAKHYFVKQDFKTSLYYLNQLTHSRYEKVYEDTYLYLGLANIGLNNLNAAKSAYKKLIDQHPNYKSDSLIILKSMLADENLRYSNKYFSFVPPQKWDAIEYPNEVIFKKPNSNSKISVTYTTITSDAGFINSYIQNINSENNGKLIQEGQASINTAPFAYAKIWEKNKQQEAYFLLRKDNKLLQIRVTPLDAENNLNLKILISTIKF